MSQVGQVYVMLGAFAVLFVSANFVGGSRCERRLEEWAAQNDFRLLSAQRHFGLSGTPWGRWSRTNRSWVFRIAVADAAGQRLNGWIRFHASLLGGTGKMDVRVPA